MFFSSIVQYLLKRERKIIYRKSTEATVLSAVEWNTWSQDARPMISGVFSGEYCFGLKVAVHLEEIYHIKLFSAPIYEFRLSHVFGVHWA